MSLWLLYADYFEANGDLAGALRCPWHDLDFNQRG